MFVDLFKNKKTFVLGLTIFISLIAIAFFIKMLSQDTFYKGIYIEGTHVGGLTRLQVEDLLNDKLSNKFNSEKILLKYNDKTWQISMEELNYQLSIKEVVNEAFNIGRDANIFKNISAIYRAYRNNTDLTCEESYDKEKLKNILLSIKSEIDIKEKNAKISYNRGQIIIENETMGTSLNIDKSMKMIENKILERDFSYIVLKVDNVIPKLISENIKDVKQVYGEFNTVFNKGNVNRSENIAVACEKINNTLLMPKEIFSMDTMLGARVAENGYKEAPIILKNELVTGIGGGICQLTSTLYNSVLLTRLEVIERKHHTLPLSYVEPGRDATIAEGYIDFKFQNNMDYPILISAEVIGNRIFTRIIGKEQNEKFTVKLKSDIIKQIQPEGQDVIIDNSLADGEVKVVHQAGNGLRVVVTRETYNAMSELINIEKISDDTYMPVKSQIKVNENYVSKEEAEH